MGVKFVAAFPSDDCTRPEGTIDDVAGLRQLLFSDFAKVCIIFGKPFSLFMMNSRKPEAKQSISWRMLRVKEVPAYSDTNASLSSFSLLLHGFLFTSIYMANNKMP
jgi:hypothetical protein